MKPAGSYRSLLTQKSFIAYLTSQFITAFNDNAFKTVVMLIALQSPESGYVDKYYIAAQLVFTLPFFLFSGYAGFFSDKHPKNKVIIATKILEVVIMLFAVYFLGKENKTMLIFVLFLLSSQSVFLSPAKYGILPEWFGEVDISRANGLVELSTFLAIILGSAIGGILMYILGEDLLLIGIVLLVLSIIGLMISFSINPGVMTATNRVMNGSPFHEIKQGINVMMENRLLATTIIGISFFFAMGLAVTTNLMVFGKEILGLTEMQLGLLNASMGVGIGVGSITAGWLSGDKIEFGLIPMGAIGLTCSIFGIGYTTSSVLTLYLVLMSAGFFAGLFIVPLNALLQDLPGKSEKGRLIATNNFFNGGTMVFAVLFIWFLQSELHFRPDSIMLALGWLTLFFSIGTLLFNPRFFVRFIMWILIHIFYRLDVVGSPNIPKTGPALIVSNHVSYIDGLVLSTVFPRFIRYLAHRYYYDHPLLNPLMRFAYAIPIESGSDQAVQDSIDRARQALQEGHVVCIFAEGRLTRTGNLLPFRTGLERITKGLNNVPVLPVHLDQLWDTFFSPRKEHQLFRLPQQFPARITVTLGDALPADAKAWQVRQAVQELAVQARISGYQREHYLSVTFFKTATAYPYRQCVYDDENKCSYKYAGFSSRVLYLAHKLKKIHKHEHRVGLYLPCSYYSILLNTAIVVAGKSVVNLPMNYSFEDIIKIKQELGIVSIYTLSDFDTGRKLINASQAVDFEPIAHDLESWATKVKFSLLGILKYFLPVKYVVKMIGQLPSSPESEISVLLPSKLQQDDKFVTVSHESIYNNVSGIKQILQFNAKDKFASCLGFNNSFAYTANLWGAFIVGCGHVPVALNDIDKFIQKGYKQKATILFANSEIFKSILDRIPINLMAYFKNLICIDDIDDDLVESFFDKFGIRIMTGFGIKELGPFVSLNTPDVRRKGMLQRGHKRGSKGHPLPNVALRIVDPLTGEILGPGEEGFLEIKTPAHMLGYIDVSTKDSFTLSSRVNRWFRTSYIGMLDEEGFLFIK